MLGQKKQISASPAACRRSALAAHAYGSQQRARLIYARDREAGEDEWWGQRGDTASSSSIEREMNEDSAHFVRICATPRCASLQELRYSIAEACRVRGGEAPTARASATSRFLIFIILVAGAYAMRLISRKMPVNTSPF